MGARSKFAGILARHSLCRLVRRRSPRSKIRSMARWLALIAITQQISCSGGAGTSGNANVDPPVSTVLTISPPSAEVSSGGTLQFTVAVQNASNSALTWQVNGIAGGNSAVGSITAAGPAAASYTAPANVPSVLTVTVTAVLIADPTKSASATVTVNPLPGPLISISPANATVVQGTPLQFSATVENGPQAVIWEVNNIAGGSAKFGTISSLGFYAAPAQIPSPPTVTITALLFSDSSIASSTSLTIVPPVPSVSISPSTANVIEGQALQFSATVQNSTDPVVWAVNGTPGGNSNVGTISTSGMYSAPIPAPQNVPLAVNVTAILQTNPQISATAGVTVISGNTLAGVYSWRNDNSLTGQNAQEEVLNPATVSGSTGHTFGKLFGCSVDGAIFAQPLYVANVTVAGVPHNVVYVATENDSVYAFDADSSSCQILWQVSFTNPMLAITAVPAADIQGQTDIMPFIGITGTPVIDPNTATLYIVSKTKINQGPTPSYSQQLHALDLTTGVERLDSPATIKGNVNGTSFDPLYENQRPALLLSGGNIYVAFDSYSDAGSFHGWVFAYDSANLQNAPAVFISTPGGSSGGIGQSGAAPSADANGNVFVVTSDGQFDANTGRSDYSETLLKLQVNSNSTSFPVFGVGDYFTPWNQAMLTNSATPFGSTGVLLLPSSAGGTVPLAVAGSQAGSLYLLDRSNLGKFSSVTGVDNVVQTLCLGAALTGTAGYLNNNNVPTVYVAAAGTSLMSFALANGKFASQSCSSGPAQPTAQSANTFALFGASPVISWDGSNANSGLVWALDTSGYLTVPAQAAILYGFQATDLTRVYGSSATTGAPEAAGPAVKFAVPTVANGKVYVGTQTELSVFGLQ